MTDLEKEERAGYLDFVREWVEYKWGIEGDAVDETYGKCALEAEACGDCEGREDEVFIQYVIDNGFTDGSGVMQFDEWKNDYGMMSFGRFLEAEINGFAIHPGETLQEVLEDWGVSAEDLAKTSDGLSAAGIADVINGKRPVTRELADGIRQATGIETSFWLRLQENYDKELKERWESAAERKHSGCEADEELKECASKCGIDMEK